MSPRFAALVAGITIACAARGAAASGPCAPSPSTSSTIVDEAVARLPSSPDLETGALGDVVIAQLVEVACGEKARPWLPGTCARPGPRGMVELRRRVVGDIARLPAVAFDRSAAGVPEAQIAARTALAVIDTLLAGGSVDALARSLAGTACVSLPAAPLPAIETAGRVLLRVIEAPPSDSAEELARRIQAALEAEGVVPAGEPLSPARSDAVKVLAEALAGAAHGPGGAPSKPPASAAIRRSFSVAAAAVTLVIDGELAIPAGSVDALIALAEGNLDAAIDAQLASFVGVDADRERRAAGEAARAGLRIASARSRDEVMRILRGKVLGPWSEPFLFDINLVKPILARDQIQLGGDLAIGYAGRWFGVRGHGSYSSYDLRDGRKLSLTNKLAGGWDLWLTLGSGKTRFDARLANEVALYGTTVVEKTGGSEITFGREASLNYRGGGLIGLRHEPNERFALAFWAGSGVQYAVHTPMELKTGAKGSLDLAQSHAASLLLQARFRAQYQVYPEYVALRLQSDIQRYAMVSAALGLDLDATGLRLTADAKKASQIEWSTRLFLDAEVARFFGMVPGVTAGFDFIHLRDTTTVSTFVPILGVGIRRMTM